MEARPARYFIGFYLWPNVPLTRTSCKAPRFYPGRGHLRNQAEDSLCDGTLD